MVIFRNLSTESARRFWASVESAVREVATWPAWRRAGINVSDRRSPKWPPCDDPDPIALGDLSVGEWFEFREPAGQMPVTVTVDVLVFETPDFAEAGE